MDRKYEVIFCVINAGFSEEVMTAARKAGARGGTIIKGRGTASREIKDHVLRMIYDSVGLDAEGQGIVFTLPVERALGLKDDAQEKNGEEKP